MTLVLPRHYGTDKTLNLLSQTYFWKGMARDVRFYIRSCDICQRVKLPIQAPAGLLQPLPIPTSNWGICQFGFYHGPSQNNFRA